MADKLQLRDWVAPVLTSVGSLFVAWFLFNLQSWRDRKNWIRDQKMAEWKEIQLRIAAVIHAVEGFPDAPNSSLTPLQNVSTSLQQLAKTTATAFFISQDSRKQLIDSVNELVNAFENDPCRAPAGKSFKDLGVSGGLCLFSSETEIRFHDLGDKFYEIARKDLGSSGETSTQKLVLWHRVCSFVRPK